MNAKWSVLSLFEDSAARVSAVEFCDALAQRFWPRVGLDLVWLDWNSLLKNPSADPAGCTDMIVVAPAQKGTLPPYVSSWLENSLRRRGEREGFLVGLCGGAELTGGRASTQQYLRKLAHQHGLDFLTGVPSSLSRSVPENREAYLSRATEMTSVLDKILHRTPPPGSAFSF